MRAGGSKNTRTKAALSELAAAYGLKTIEELISLATTAKSDRV
jgi:hypothetical protein